MTSRIFEVNFADIPVRYQFRKTAAARNFARHIHLSQAETFNIRMNDDEFRLFRSVHADDIPDEYVEYKGLLYLTALYLLEYQCCIMHAVAFLWRGKAWLLTAESGTGKTTQYLNWTRLFPDEIEMISGDMPVLDFRTDKIIVHPSPWNGKENIGSSVSGELGGIVILKQGSDNRIKDTDTEEGILTLFRQFTALPETATQIHALAGMVERIMADVPIWSFTNTGTDTSTCILRESLLEYSTEEDTVV